MVLNAVIADIVALLQLCRSLSGAVILRGGYPWQ